MKALVDIPDVELGSELGHGASSIVFRGRYAGGRCAVKVPLARGRWTRWIYREAVALARVRHAALPAVFEVGEVDGVPYLVMELVEGETLADLLVEGPLAPRRAIEIAGELLSALSDVHAAGLVHRDVKPRNVMIEADGRVRLVDFGFVAPVAAIEDSAGTPRYASPEQVSRPASVDGRSDLFAVGRLLLEMLGDDVNGADPLVRALIVFAGHLAAPRREARYADALTAHADLERLRSGRDLRGPTARDLRRHSAPVGRERELRRLRTAWDQVSRKGGGVAVVSGESGSGKTTLVEAFAFAAFEAAGQVTAVQCRDGDEPLATIRRIAEAANVDLPRSTDAQGDATTETFVEAAAERLVRVLSAQGPHVLVVDDLQWIDPLSGEVLRRLRHRLEDARTLLVLATRNASERAEADFVLTNPTGPQIEMVLGPLHGGDVAGLIGAFFGGGAVNPSLAFFVRSIGEGTPLAIVETLRTLIDAGAVRPRAGAWVFEEARARQIALRASTRALLARRIDELPLASQRVLETGALLGRTFEVAVLADAVGLAEADVTFAVADGSLAGLLALDDSGVARFVHDSVRDLLCERLGADERRELHQRIAGVLEARGARENVFAVARHYAAGTIARAPSRAYAASRAAAKVALARFDNETAILFLTHARAAADAGGGPLDVSFHGDLGEAHLRLGGIVEALRAFELAARDAESAIERARIFGRIAWLHQVRGDVASAKAALSQAFEALDRHLPGARAPDALRALADRFTQRLVPGRTLTDRDGVAEATLLGSLHYQNARLGLEYGEPVRLLVSALEARRISTSLDLPREKARTGAILGVVLTAMRQRARGARMLDDAVQAARAMDDRQTLVFCRQLKSVATAWAGDFDAALALARESIDGDGHWLELNEYCLLASGANWMESIRGQDDEAWKFLSRAVDRLRRTHLANDDAAVEVLYRARATFASLARSPADDPWLGERAEHLSMSHLRGFQRLGCWGPRLRECIELDGQALSTSFDRLCEEFYSEGHSPRSAHMLLTEAYVAIAHGRATQCIAAPQNERGRRLEQLRRAASDLRVLASVPVVRAHSQAIDGYLAWLDGDLQRTEKLLSQAEAMANRETCPWVLFAVARCRAHVLAVRGHDATSRDYARAAEAIAVGHGSAARARLMRAELGLGSTPPATLSSLGSTRSSLRSGSLHLRRQLAILLDVVRAPKSNAKPEQHAATILDALIRALDADSATLFFQPDRGGNGRRETFHVSRGKGGAIGTVAPWEMLLVEQAVEQRRTLPDDGGAAWSYGGEGPLDVRRVLATSLVLNDQTVGGVSFERRLEAPAFTYEDRELLELLSTQVPISLEVARLVAEREELHASLQQSQKLEAVGQLAAGVAHDFNNLLGAMKLAAETLRMDPRFPGDLREDIDIVETAIRRAEDLAKRLLAFSRHKAGTPTRVNVNAAVEDIVPLLRRTIGRDLLIDVALASRSRSVYVDRASLDATLVNLSVNARDPMNEHGKILISTEDVVLTEDAVRRGAPRPGNYVCITVEDDGRGIPEEQLVKVFDPFFTTKGKGNTGLGLTMVYAFAKNSGGCVFVESTVGVGTRFRVYLPTLDDLHGATTIPPISPRSLIVSSRSVDSARTILLVDDDDVLRESIRRVLEHAGHRVVAAGGPVEALQLAAHVSSEIGVMILDVVMPGMTGPELAEKLLEMKLRAKVLFVSGYAPDNLPVGMRSITTEALLTKPFGPEDLLLRVRRLFEIGRDS